MKLIVFLGIVVAGHIVDSQLAIAPEYFKHGLIFPRLALSLLDPIVFDRIGAVPDMLHDRLVLIPGLDLPAVFQAIDTHQPNRHLCRADFLFSGQIAKEINFGRPD